MAIDFSYLEGVAPQEESLPIMSDTANVTIRVDADSMLLCDGEYIDQVFKAGVLTKIQMCPGQHLLEFLYTEDPDIKIEKEVDFPESGKSYLVFIKGLKDLVDAAEAEAKHKAEEEVKRKAEEEVKRKAEEAKRKTGEEALFDLILLKVGDNVFSKMRVTKVVMDATGLSIGKGKELVDSAPCIIKKSISKSQAETLKRQLEEAGAIVEIK